MKHVNQNRSFFLWCQTDWRNEVIFNTMAYQGFLKYRVSFKLVIVSHENSKCVDFASVQVKHIVENRPFLSLMPNWMKKWVIIDIMAYQRLLKYPISFSLFKVSEPWKFQELITLEDGISSDMIKYHFSLILKLCLRGGGLMGGGGGGFQSGKDYPKVFWLQVTWSGSSFPENPIGNWASIADLD